MSIIFIHRPAGPACVTTAAPPEEEEGLSKQTIVTISAIGGGLLGLGLVLTAVLPPGAPTIAVVAAAFAGAVALLVGAILGASSRKFDSTARIGFGIGAVLAGILLLFVILVGPAVATQGAPVCGVAAAGPGLFALRAFAMMRDAGA